MKLARILFIMLALSLPSFGQGALVPWIATTYPNTSGALPNTLGYLCSLAAGTTTPAATYSDSGLSVPNTNPMPLNSAGRPTSSGVEVSIFLSPASYKFISYAPGTGNTCNGTTVGAVIRSVDNVSDIGQLITQGLAPVATPSSTIGSLPAAGTAGRVERVTNGVRGLWTDNGTKWIPQNAGIINALEYGATGDGTTDDSTALNNALAAAATLGGTLYLPPTTSSGAASNYNLGSTTLASTSPVNLECGRGTQIKYSGGGFALSFGSTSGNTANYSLAGCSFLTTTNGANALQMEELHNFSIRDVYVQGANTGSQTSVCLSVDGRAVDSLFGLVEGLVCNHMFIGLQSLSTGSVNKATTLILIGFSDFNDSIATSKCVDFGSSGNGDGFTFVGGNCEASDFGFYGAGGAGHSPHFVRTLNFRFENITTNTIFLDAFTQGFEFNGSSNIDAGSGVSDSSAGCNYYVANTVIAGTPYPDQECGAGAMFPSITNTGSLGKVGHVYADVESTAVNSSNAPVISTGGFSGGGVSASLSTHPFLGLAASGAGGVNYELGANGSTDIHELIQSGGTGTTFTARSINPGNGITTFNAGTIGNGNAGILWVTGAGAPSGACQSGSLYTNSTGGTGTTLYACQSSLWVAK